MPLTRGAPAAAGLIRNTPVTLQSWALPAGRNLRHEHRDFSARVSQLEFLISPRPVTRGVTRCPARHADDLPVEPGLIGQQLGKFIFRDRF